MKGRQRFRTCWMTDDRRGSAWQRHTTLIVTGPRPKMCILLNCVIQGAPAAQCKTGIIKRATDYPWCIRWDEIIRSGTIALGVKTLQVQRGWQCVSPLLPLLHQNAASGSGKDVSLRGRREKHKARGRRWEKIWVRRRMMERDSVWITMCKHVRGPDLIISSPPGSVITYLIKERDKSKRERDILWRVLKKEKKGLAMT